MLLIGSLVLAGVSVALQLYVPILFGRAIDGILGPGQVDFPLVGRYASQILFLVVLSSLATWAMNLINNQLAFNTVRDIRSRAIRQIQQLPLSFLDGHSTGDLVQRVIATWTDFRRAAFGVHPAVFRAGDHCAHPVFHVFHPPEHFSHGDRPDPGELPGGTVHRQPVLSAVPEPDRHPGEADCLINETIGNEKVVKAFCHKNVLQTSSGALTKSCSRPPREPCSTAPSPTRPPGR